MRPLVYRIHEQIYKIWRRRRFRLFLRLAQPKVDHVLLDVGGYPGDWAGRDLRIKRIDVLNIFRMKGEEADEGRPAIRTVVGDGCQLDLPDESYDIAFSNSVIEHVGSWERQQAFAREIRRVGKTVWVQCPAYECPIEPHYLTPVVHYLTPRIQKKIVRWFTVAGWVGRPSQEEVNRLVDSTRLLRRDEMQELFPDCEIITERVFWIMPKSHIAFRSAS